MPDEDKRFLFEPDRIVLEKKDQTMIDARNNPEKSFAGQVRETPWDDIHATYFVGEALWTYFNTPFLYTHEGSLPKRLLRFKQKAKHGDA